jgi:hypothetical protein
MFGTNNRDVPRLLDYAEAVAHEASIKPIRGRSVELKPIGDRRNQHKTIRKNPDGSIACRLHSTDVVTFHEDGRIEVCWGGYVTQTTSSFISKLLGTSTALQHSHAWIMAQHNGGNTTSTITGDYAMHPTEPNILRRIEPVDKTRPWIRPAPLHFENPMPVITHRINRAGANRARKQYKAFKDYIVRTMRIRDEGFSTQEFGEVFGWVDEGRGLPRYPHLSQYTRQELLELAKSEQNQDHYTLSLILAWEKRKFSFSGGFFKQQLKAMLGGLDEYILREHRDECFDEVRVPAGEIQKDPYKKFF